MNRFRFRYYHVLFCIVTFLYWFSLYAYVPMLAPYSESIGATHKMIGLIVGSYGFTQMLLRIPLGIYSDKLNKRKPFITFGLFISIISSLGLWYFPNPWLIFIFRSLAGVTAATWVTMTVLFSSYFKKEDTAAAIGIINSINALGQVLAMLLGGFAAQHISQTMPFLIAAIGAIAALLLSLKIEEKEDLQRKPLKTYELVQVIKNKNLILVSILAIFSQLIIYATVFGFTPIYAKNIGATDFQISLLSVLSVLPIIIVPILSGAFISKRYGDKKTIVIGFLILSLSTILIPYINSINFLYISQIAGGFGRGMVFPMLMSLSIKKVEESKRATAMGFFQAIYGVGMFVGPIIVGVLSDFVGLSWGFVAVASIGVLGILTTFFLK